MIDRLRKTSLPITHKKYLIQQTRTNCSQDEPIAHSINSVRTKIAQLPPSPPLLPQSCQLPAKTIQVYVQHWTTNATTILETKSQITIAAIVQQLQSKCCIPSDALHQITINLNNKKIEHMTPSCADTVLHLHQEDIFSIKLRLLGGSKTDPPHSSYRRRIRLWRQYVVFIPQLRRRWQYRRG